MDVHFLPVEFSAISSAVRDHYASLPSLVDSFLEDHILASTHYRIAIDGEDAGFTSIHAGSLITQFALYEPFRHLGQDVFSRARRLEQVQSAFVPTCDEYFLSHALDDYRQVAKQGYFFALASNRILSPRDSYSLRLATRSDIELITKESGDFLSDVTTHIAREELFLTLRDEHPVGFGILIKSAIYPNVASIGMYTIERHRHAGVGTATISLLIDECRRQGLRPVAGCWYYNHLSKQTLERAGMYSPTRLLKIGF